MVSRLGEWDDCNRVCAQRVQAQVEVQVVLKQAGRQMIRQVCAPLYPDFFTRLIWGFQQSSWSPPLRTDTYHFGIPVGIRALTGGTLFRPLFACDLCAPAPPHCSNVPSVYTTSFGNNYGHCQSPQPLTIYPYPHIPFRYRCELFYHCFRRNLSYQCYISLGPSGLI